MQACLRLYTMWHYCTTIPLTAEHGLRNGSTSHQPTTETATNFGVYSTGTRRNQVLRIKINGERLESNPGTGTASLVHHVIP